MDDVQANRAGRGAGEPGLADFLTLCTVVAFMNGASENISAIAKHYRLADGRSSRLVPDLNRLANDLHSSYRRELRDLARRIADDPRSVPRRPPYLWHVGRKGRAITHRGSALLGYLARALYHDVLAPGQSTPFIEIARVARDVGLNDVTSKRVRSILKPESKKYRVSGLSAASK